MLPATSPERSLLAAGRWAAAAWGLWVIVFWGGVVLDADARRALTEERPGWSLTAVDLALQRAVVGREALIGSWRWAAWWHLKGPPVFSGGRLPQRTVVFGRDGYAFYGKGAMDSLRNRPPSSPAAVDGWGQALIAFRRAHADLPVVIAPAPNKATILADRLPAWLHRHAGTTRLDQVLARVAVVDEAAALDLRPVLHAAGPARALRRLDSHWSEAGSWAVVGAIAERLRAQGLAVPSPTPSPRFVEVTRDDGDLQRVLGLPGWLQASVVVADPPLGTAEVNVGEERRLPGAVEGGPVVGLVADSFGVVLAPALAQIVGEVVFWRRRSPVAVSDPRLDAVVAVFVERSFEAAPAPRADDRGRDQPPPAAAATSAR
jgi:hypothetical protein